MSDTLHQGARIAGDDASPDSIASTVLGSIHALEEAAERRPFPLALDWSRIAIVVGPDATWPGGLKVNVSAPVL